MSLTKSTINDFNICFFSSGSSGNIKCIVHSEQTLINAINSYFDTFKIEQNFNTLNVLPQNHLGGLLSSLRALLAGTELSFSDQSLSLSRSLLTHLSAGGQLLQPSEV